jgi:hypothetical protein
LSIKSPESVRGGFTSFPFGGRLRLTDSLDGEVNGVAYEPKVLLIAIAKIASKAGNVEEVYNAVADMANAEGVVLKPYEEAVNGDAEKGG